MSLRCAPTGASCSRARRCVGVLPHGGSGTSIIGSHECLTPKNECGERKTFPCAMNLRTCGFDTLSGVIVRRSLSPPRRQRGERDEPCDTIDQEGALDTPMLGEEAHPEGPD